MCYLNLSFRRALTFFFQHMGALLAEDSTAEFLTGYCLCSKEIICPQRQPLFPQGQPELKTCLIRGIKISLITSIQDNSEGPVQLQNYLRLAEVFLATTAQFSDSIFPLLLFSLSYMSMLRSLFSKPTASRAP